MKSEFDYITVGGNAVTPNTTIYPGGNITGPLTSTTTSDNMSFDDFDELAMNFVVTAVSGTSPTLTVKLVCLDPMESGITPPLTLTLNSSAITAASTMRFIIKDGVATVWINGSATSLGNMNLPMVLQVQFAIGGTSPSFSVVATYEARSYT